MNNNLNRRNFLQSGAVAVTVAMNASSASASEKNKTDESAKILNYQPEMKYRQLGKTDIHLSVIAMGGLVMNDYGESHHHAIERGCNFFHISKSYGGGRCIKILGKVMKEKRDKVYLAIKDDFFTDSDYKSGKLDKIDWWLKALNTDYVDFFMFNRHDGNQAANPYLKEAFEKLKAQGKVRYAGLTTHDDVKNVVSNGIESGYYDLINPMLNQNAYEDLQEQLRDAHAKNISIMPMKTMKGLKTREQELAFLKKLLNNPAITTVVKGIGSTEMFDDYMKAASETLTSMEDRMLYRYAQANRSDNCMMCSSCKRVCPEHLEISTVLRCKDYYADQVKDTSLAMETYHELSPEKRWSQTCTDCSKCEDACPNGLNIVDRLNAAKKMFA